MDDRGLSGVQKTIKRIFDIFFSIVGIILFFFPVLILVLLASISTGRWGILKQERIGLNGKVFKMYKIRSMKDDCKEQDFITVAGDKRITPFGKFLRKYKLDELPQLINVLLGDMSFVGPRPDVKGYADRLEGNDRLVLSVRPGITGPATLRFKDEEAILEQKKDPKNFNDKVIWPEKVQINIRYIENWTLWNDIKLIFKTIF